MNPSQNPDPEIRRRANELLSTAGYRIEETASELEERTAITRRANYLFMTLGVLFSVALVVTMALLNIAASQRNQHMYDISKVLLLLACVSYYIKAYVQLGKLRPQFIRFWKALGSFGVSYCVSLLFVIAIP